MKTKKQIKNHFLTIRTIIAYFYYSYPKSKHLEGAYYAKKIERVGHLIG